MVGELGRTVGRRAELEAVSALIAELRAGTGGALVLRGEAGIGKSHLARVAAQRAADARVQVAIGAADELEQDRPGRLLGRIEEALAQQADGTSSEGDTHGPLTGDAATVDAPADGGDPAYRVVERFVTGVERATGRAPVLVIAEDLHWADDVTLRGLAMLLRSVGQVPCAVVATQRNHPRPRRLADVESAIERASGTVIELPGLGVEAVDALASSRVGATVGPTLRSMLLGAAGNPLMIEELLRAADRGQMLRVADGVADVAPGELPSSLDDALLRILRSLPDATVEALRHASLLGRHFSATEVAALLGSSVVATVEALGPAVDAGMVLATGPQHEFRHDLVRDAVYRSIAPAARWDLHRAAATALVEAGAPPLRVAQQVAAGARPGDLEAVGWLRRAAADALALDTGTAADLLRRALSLAPPDWSERDAVEADLVELLAWSGRVEEATQRGQALVDRSISGSARVRAHQALGTVRSSSGDLLGAAAELLVAADLDACPPETAVQLRCAAGGMQLIGGAASPEEVRAHATPHLASEHGDVVCWARQTLAIAAISEGAYEEAVEHARVAVSILDDRYVPPLGFLIPHTWLMTGLMYLDRLDEAVAAGQRARARAEQRGDVGLLVQVMAGTCGLTWMEADWDETVAEIEASFALAEDTGAPVHGILLHALAAQIAAERGHPDEAMAQLEAGEALAASGTLHLFGLEMLALERARHVARAGDVAAACDLLDGVWSLTAGIRGMTQWRLVGPELVGLCLAAGRSSRASEVVDEIDELAQRSGVTSGTAAAEQARGLLAADPGRLVDAAGSLMSTQRRVEAAAACERAVRVAAERGQHLDDVPRLLDAADEIHRRAAASDAVARVASLRAEAGLERREESAPARFGWESLTPKELEVVALVSRGSSNPEIAAELYISRRTVEAHLSHVFRKLDVGNRTQLAREAIERGISG